MRNLSILLALAAHCGATPRSQVAPTEGPPASAIVYSDSITFTFPPEAAVVTAPISPDHRWKGAPLRIWEVLLRPYEANQTYTLTVREEWNSTADEERRPLSTIVRSAKIYRGVAAYDCMCIGAVPEPALTASVLDSSIHLVVRGAAPVAHILATMRDTVTFTRWQANGQNKPPIQARYPVAVEYHAPKLSPNDR